MDGAMCVQESYWKHFRKSFLEVEKSSKYVRGPTVSESLNKIRNTISIPEAKNDQFRLNSESFGLREKALPENE
jgi:hypothetical protein